MKHRPMQFRSLRACQTELNGVELISCSLGTQTITEGNSVFVDYRLWNTTNEAKSATVQLSWGNVSNIKEHTLFEGEEDHTGGLLEFPMDVTGTADVQADLTHVEPFF